MQAPLKVSEKYDHLKGNKIFSPCHSFEQIIICYFSRWNVRKWWPCKRTFCQNLLPICLLVFSLLYFWLWHLMLHLQKSKTYSFVREHRHKCSMTILTIERHEFRPHSGHRRSFHPLEGIFLMFWWYNKSVSKHMYLSGPLKWKRLKINWWHITLTDRKVSLFWLMKLYDEK